ncbi:helix-turn-helix domain-containing protein [Solirhodobacter olei]|uniref:helix-turn-helix domain-containing protein n=1 Tax=Solirhodobacter olei TaxID=2493082 RepID=UPI000FDC533F|nr:helix-turn-helix transcriptional regulator [Solirhodobacter olei]
MAPEAQSDWFSEEAATFGDRLAGAREAAGMSQAELARRLGVRLKTLVDWENDFADPRSNRLQMVAGMLNVSIMWLLTGRGEGVDAPGAQSNETPEARALIDELRLLRTEALDLSHRMGRLEKRLRSVLAEKTTA